MTTLSHHTIKVYVILLLNLFAINLSAQENQINETRTVQLDTVSIVANQQSFKNMVCDIVFDQNFKYRKALRKSRLTKKEYVFSHKKVSETDILRQFKRSARKAETVSDFRDHIYRNDMEFIELLDMRDIRFLYVNFRKGTFNNYLSELDAAIGSI